MLCSPCPFLLSALNLSRGETGCNSGGSQTTLTELSKVNHTVGIDIDIWRGPRLHYKQRYSYQAGHCKGSEAASQKLGRAKPFLGPGAVFLHIGLCMPTAGAGQPYRSSSGLQRFHVVTGGPAGGCEDFVP